MDLHHNAPNESNKGTLIVHTHPPVVLWTHSWGRPTHSELLGCFRHAQHASLPENCRGIPSEADHCPWL